MPTHPHSESIARCPTKQRYTRPEAIDCAESLGYPVIPYKCPNGWDHWHVGHSMKVAPSFYGHRKRWESRIRNQDGEEVEQPRPPDC